MTTTSTPPPRRDHEAGETLLEVLIAMIILGGAIAALLAGLATGVLGSASHREMSSANALLRSYAEALELTARTSYINCATTYNVSPTAYVSPAGWATPTTTVQTTGCPAADSGLQRVTITVTTPRSATQSMDIWLRRP